MRSAREEIKINRRAGGEIALFERRVDGWTFFKKATKNHKSDVPSAIRTLVYRTSFATRLLYLTYNERSFFRSPSTMYRRACGVFFFFVNRWRRYVRQVGAIMCDVFNYRELRRAMRPKITSKSACYSAKKNKRKICLPGRYIYISNVKSKGAKGA